LPRVTEEHKRQRRNQILLAAATVFGSKGFHVATMDEICREAGLSAGAVYSYFASKDAIIGALGALSAANSAAQASSVVAGEDPASGLAELARSMIAGFEVGNEAEVNVQFWAEATRSAQVHGTVVAAIANGRAALDSAVRELLGAEAGITPEAAGDILVALMSGRMLLVALGIACPADEYADGVEAVIRGLRNAQVR